MEIIEVTIEITVGLFGDSGGLNGGNSYSPLEMGPKTFKTLGFPLFSL